MAFLFGPPNIERLRAKADVARLVEALSYPKDSAVRSAAAEAIGALGAAAGRAGLVAALADADAGV